MVYETLNFSEAWHGYDNFTKVKHSTNRGGGAPINLAVLQTKRVLFIVTS